MTSKNGTRRPVHYRLLIIGRAPGPLLPVAPGYFWSHLARAVHLLRVWVIPPTTVANERKNKIREEAPVEEAPKRERRARKSAPPTEGKFARFKAFLADERTHKVGGLFLVLTSAFLLVAFTSYFFTWRIDQDITSRSWGAIFDRSVHVENWLGKLGALTSHQFIHQWFGVAAFVFVLWSFLLGVRILLGSWIMPARRTLGWSAMTLFWVPALLGFFFAKTDYTFLGGGIGYTITAHLSTMLGTFGTGALLLFAAGAFAVFTFNPRSKRWAACSSARPWPSPMPWTRPTRCP